MTDLRPTRPCRTEHCERATLPDSGFCAECLAIVWRTGRPPVIPERPAWLRRLTARDNTGAIYGGKAA